MYQLSAPSHPNNLKDCRRHIVRRIPEIDHSDFSLPEGVPYVSSILKKIFFMNLTIILKFCIPGGFCVETQSEYERKPFFFAFSLTAGDGSRAYGFVLHFYDELAGPSIILFFNEINSNVMGY
jgi:hypothetical protein